MAKKKTETEKQADKACDNFIDSITKQYGAGCATKLFDIMKEKTEIIPTTISLDIALNGGMAHGQLVEIKGKQKCGKTTLAFHIASNFQKLFKGHVFFLKAEGRLSKELVKTIDGLDHDITVIKSTADKILIGTDFLNIAEAIIKDTKGSFIILDSIAGLIGEKENTETMSDRQMGELPQMMTKFSRKNGPIIGTRGHTFVALNHLRDNFNSPYGGTISPGGKHFKHQCDTILKLLKKEPIKTKEEPIGHSLGIGIESNAIGGPVKEIVVPLIYGKGIDIYRDMIKCAIDFGIMSLSGAYFKYEDKTVGQGIEKAVNTIKENKEMYDEILKKIRALGLPDDIA